MLNRLMIWGSASKGRVWDLFSMASKTAKK
jgi:hypothetical protein